MRVQYYYYYDCRKDEIQSQQLWDFEYSSIHVATVYREYQNQSIIINRGQHSGSQKVYESRDRWTVSNTVRS